ncbi:MAG: dipeptidyl-peptidase-4 [Pseudohongiellaceae bacterium]|jgi:dipeptidyl-peptidase-4
MTHPFLSLMVLLLVPALPQDEQNSPPSGPLVTVAESSGFRATASHQDVIDLVDALVDSSPLATRSTMGRTSEDREIPLLIVADPPVNDAAGAQAAVDDGRILCLVFANIHAGEVCGKAATLILARELLANPTSPDNAALLQRLVIVFAPIFNGDGNERMAPDNRPGQLGPDAMGIRPNAMGLDLNRDYMRLESPEVSSMASFLHTWKPQLIMDLHTTNGSHHRYALTWSPPLNPAGPQAPLAIVRDRLLPDVTNSLAARTGLRTFAYGNFEEDHSRWATYSSLPRFGAQYHGLRGHLSILSEAYSHITFEERVVATLEFVRECLSWTAENADDVRNAFNAGLEETIALGRAAANGQPDQVGIRHAIAAASEPATLLGWVEETDDDGLTVPTSETRDYVVEHFDHFEPVAFVTRPVAYIIPAGFDAVVDLLRRHGITVAAASETLGNSTKMTVERYAIDAALSGGTQYLGHATPDISATPVCEDYEPTPGDWIVGTDQPLGTLAIQLLEPEAEDSLAPHLLSEFLAPGSLYPVLRVVR